MSDLLEDLWSVPAVDQHAHNINRPELAPGYNAAFTQSLCSTVWQRDTPHGMFFRRSQKRLARLFGCDPTAEAVRAVREAMTIEELTERCLRSANLASLVLDDGLSPENLLPWQWHQAFVPTYRLIRIEHLAQELFASHRDFAGFEEAFRAALEGCGPEVVGFKCIAAYRGGLDVPDYSREDAKDDYPRARGQRISTSPFYSYLIQAALETASLEGLPVQFHTGFGDTDLDLERSNPLLLLPLIRRYSCPFVLLHAGYPYFREVGYLASVYSNVYTDFGLSVPYLSVAGMRATVSGLLELAPLNKVMYSSDASLIPELFYLGAVHGREVLADVLTESWKNGDLSTSEAEQAGRGILAENAGALYFPGRSLASAAIGQNLRGPE